jgi:hypothetical protein
MIIRFCYHNNVLLIFIFVECDHKQRRDRPHACDNRSDPLEFVDVQPKHELENVDVSVYIAESDKDDVNHWNLVFKEPASYYFVFPQMI